MGSVTPELFPYQLEGARFLYKRKRALLADEMGLGKTPQAIRAASEIDGLKVVLCPSILKFQWAREIRKFAPDSGPIQQAETAKEFKLDPKAEWVIMTYPLVSRKGVADHLKVPIAVLICDESHFLRKTNSKRHKVVLNANQSGRGSISAHADRVWFLTGTPAPNSILDMFIYFKFCGVWPGSEYSFRTFFTEGYEGEHGYIVTENKNLPEYRLLKKRFMLRRLKRQVKRDLPPLIVSTIEVAPVISPLADADMLQRLSETDRELTEMFEKKRQEGKLGEYDQHLTSLRRELGALKTLPVCQLIEEELQSSQGAGKVVVFGIHRIVLQHVRAFLHKYRAKLIFGGSDPVRRQLMIDEFQSNPACRVMVCQINAAGVGLNLTAASSVWILEPDWIPGTNEQAIARCHRIGQDDPVLVRLVSLAGTMDVRINEIIANKVDLSREATDDEEYPGAHWELF